VETAYGLLGRGRDLAASLGTVAVGLGVASARWVTGAAEDRPAADPGAGGDDVRALGVGPHSRWVDLDGPVHYLDFGGPASGPTVVCVHGLAGSAVNWSAIAPLLAGTCRMLAVDLPGHGLTRSQRRGTGVPAMHALLHRFIETVPVGRVILCGNSMGGMISLLEASAAPPPWPAWC
jgi:hypothetical protein